MAFPKFAITLRFYSEKPIMGVIHRPTLHMQVQFYGTTYKEAEYQEKQFTDRIHLSEFPMYVERTVTETRANPSVIDV